MIFDNRELMCLQILSKIWAMFEHFSGILINFRWFFIILCQVHIHYGISRLIVNPGREYTIDNILLMPKIVNHVQNVGYLNRNLIILFNLVLLKHFNQYFKFTKGGNFVSSDSKWSIVLSLKISAVCKP